MPELDADEMQRIIVDEMLGNEPTVTGDEADEFRRDIRPDIELARKNKWIIDIPPDL